MSWPNIRLPTFSAKNPSTSFPAGICDKNTDEAEAAKLFIQSIKDMNSKMGIGTKIESIKDEDIELLSYYADKEANPVYPVPVLMDKKELQKFYYDLI